MPTPDFQPRPHDELVEPLFAALREDLADEESYGPRRGRWRWVVLALASVLILGALSLIL